MQPSDTAFGRDTAAEPFLQAPIPTYKEGNPLPLISLVTSLFPFNCHHILSIDVKRAYVFGYIFQTKTRLNVYFTTFLSIIKVMNNSSSV